MKMARMPMGKPVRIATAVLVVAAITGLRVDAQRPERQREVKIPGIDVSLRAGWQLLFRDGCRFAVPGTWHANRDASLALAPDGSNLSVRMFRITSWRSYTAQIRAAFGHLDIVHEDSERRLWFEIGVKPIVQHFIDVSNGLNVCSGLLEIRAATTPDAEDTTNRIVESIGPAPEKWPPDSVE
jgi:hypothetical protein